MTIRMECGCEAGEGDRVWNYYDGYAVTIAEAPDHEGWVRTTKDGESYGPSLNGQRMCCLDHGKCYGHIRD